MAELDPKIELQHPSPVVLCTSDGKMTSTGAFALTDAQLRATPVPVTISGGGGGGGLTDAELRATPVPISGTVVANVGTGTQPVSGTVAVSNFPASQAVTGTFWQATQPVSGTVTANAGSGTFATSESKLPSGLVAPTTAPAGTEAGLVTRNIPSGTQPISGSVSVSNFPATQPVSGSVSVSNFPASQAVTGTFFQATQPVSITSMPSTPVTGTFWQATQPVSAASLPLPTGASTEATLSTLNGKVTACNTGAVAGSVSLGSSTGKTNVGQTGSLVTTTTTADQVVKTYTVTAGKTLYITAISLNVRLTTFATTATLFGTGSLETPSGTKLYTETLAGPGVLNTPVSLIFAEPIPVAASTVVRLVCTPAAATSFTWQGTIFGYEK